MKVTDGQPLESVPPHVRRKMLQRIAVVKRYLRDRTRANAERSAAELGLSVVHFKKLARIWELHGDASRLPGADWPKTKSTATSEQQLQILREANGAIPSAAVERVVKAALAIAAERNVGMPSLGTMRARIQEIRIDHSAPRELFGSDATLVVVHAALNIAVAHGTSSTMPVAALVIEPRSRAVLGLGLSLTGPDPAATARALVGAMDRLPLAVVPRDGCPFRLAMDIHDNRGWSELAMALVAAGVTIEGKRRTMPRRDLAIAYLGRKVGGIELRPRQVMRKPAARDPYVASGETPVTIEEARAFAEKRMIPTVAITATSAVVANVRTVVSDWLNRFSGKGE